MSVTFWPIDPTRAQHEWDQDRNLNVSNENARLLLNYLGLPGWEEPQPCGEASVKEIMPKCMRRLWNEKRNEDPGEGVHTIKSGEHSTVVHCGRRPGYLPEKAQALLDLCKAAEHSGFTHLTWG